MATSRFGPEWLSAQLASLAPGFPDVDFCIALSGGVDSTALLAAMASLPHGRKHSRLRAVHVDHGIHPNSSQWSAHCRALAKQLGVPLEVVATKVARVRGVSLEAAAREARYRIFVETLRQGEVLLTAHQQDDQFETVLLQLFRGSGLAGIAAMPAVAPLGHGWLVRPLLSRSRAELEEWVRERELTWVEDDTNADERFDRNFLRRRVLPAIRERWPGAPVAVSRSSRHAAEAQRILDAVARTDVERSSYGDSLSVKKLRALPLERRRNALRFWVAAAGRLVPDTRRLDEIAGPMIDARPDANPFVAWDENVVQRHADLLTLATLSRKASQPANAAPSSEPSQPADVTPSSEVSHPTELTWAWRTSMTCALPAGCGELELKRDERGPLDLDALPESLTIRWRSGGERLRPRRGGPRRPLKNLLQEAHVSIAERARFPLIFSGERLICAADLWLDESVQATPAARHRARLLWKKSRGEAEMW